MKYAIDVLQIQPAVKTLSAESNILQLAAISDNPAAVTYAYELNKVFNLELTPEKRNNKGHDAFFFASKSLEPQLIKDALINPSYYSKPEEDEVGRQAFK